MSKTFFYFIFVVWSNDEVYFVAISMLRRGYASVVL